MKDKNAEATGKKGKAIEKEPIIDPAHPDPIKQKMKIEPDGEPTPVSADSPTVLPVPNITEITPFANQPIVHEHANLGTGKSIQGGENENGEKTDNNQKTDEKTGKPGKGIVNDSAPPLMEGQQSGPGATDPNNAGGQQEPSMQMNVNQVRQTFDMGVGIINNLIGTAAPKLTKVKMPEEMKLLSSDLSEKYHHINEMLSARRTETLKLSKDEIEMLRGPAEACIAEAGIRTTPQQALLMVAAQIVISKAIIIKGIKDDNKEIREQWRADIATMIKVQDGNLKSMREMVQEMGQMRDELNKFKEYKESQAA